MLRIGPAGVPASTPKPGGTLEGVRRCKQVGLPSMEVQFVRGVHMKNELAQTIGEEAQRLDIALSIHGPYFINLCSPNEPNQANSRRYLLESAERGSLLHATTIVFHPGAYQGQPKDVCEKAAKRELQQVLDEMAQQGWDEVALGPELTGKKSAYGDLEEILELARHFGLRAVRPVIDFGHYHARIGRIASAADYERILDRAEEVLGPEYKNAFHCHFTEISFTPAGERAHLPLGDGKPKYTAPDTGAGGPPYQPLLQVLQSRGYNGSITCESTKPEEDAQLMWAYYNKLSSAAAAPASRKPRIRPSA